MAVDGESVEIANVESPSHVRVGRYGVDVEKFEDFAIHKLREALSSKKIIVIDELGFMQMLSASFQSMVQEIISDRRIVLGTIPVESRPEIDTIKYRKEVGIVSLNEFNRDVMPEVVMKDILRALEDGGTCG